MTSSPHNNRHDEQSPLLGEILIRRRLITDQQLQEALQTQQNNHGLVGEILVDLGYCEELDIVAALIVQCGIPYIAINKYDLDKKILKLIPESIVREFHVIPLDRVGDVVSVVMSDPLNTTIREKLKEITACRIAPFIASKSEISKAIARWYGDK